MHTPDIYRIWVYLSSTPLLWLSATLVAFAIGDAVSARFHRNPLAVGLEHGRGQTIKQGRGELEGPNAFQFGDFLEQVV